MQKKNLINRIKPIIVLFILSPIIAELLSGSTPVSRAEQLIFESVFYGSAALLIRELVRRYQLGWFSMILLGFAFGIVEECLLLQSAFNPHFLTYDITFGRLWGVNWAWAEIIITNHSIWSITMPVLFAEMIFPDRKSQPWLNKIGIVVFAVLFLVSSFGFYTTFYKMSGFTTSWIHYTVAGLLALIIIVTAIKLPVKPLVKYHYKTPPAWVIGIIFFFVSLIWLNLLSLVFKKDPAIPAWFVELSGIVILSVVLLFILGWINSKWNDIHRFSLASGALSASLIFGLFILIQSKNNLDITCQIGFILIAGFLIVKRWKSLLNSSLQQE
jgi:hypothetical protein